MMNRITLPYLILGMALAGVAVAVACDQATASGPTAAMAPGSTAVSAGGPDSTAGPSSTPTSPGTGNPPPAGIGTLSLLLKDSPFSEASALLVTFTGVIVHKDGGDSTTGEGEWVPLTFTGGASSRTCDLKRLVASTDVLGTGPLTAGHYTQVRLTVSDARIYNSATTAGPACNAVLAPTPASDKGVPVTVASGTLKLSREFDVPAGGAVMMLLDFDGDGSVHKTGNGKYMMTPVIRVVSVQ